MASVVDLLSALLLLLGVLCSLTGAVGLFRLPDFFTRVHAVGITDSMAALLIIAALILQAGLTLISVKLLFILIFLLVTSPTASHALAKAARHGGLLTLHEQQKKIKSRGVSS